MLSYNIEKNHYLPTEPFKEHSFQFSCYCIIWILLQCSTIFLMEKRILKYIIWVSKWRFIWIVNDLFTKARRVNVCDFEIIALHTTERYFGTFLCIIHSNDLFLFLWTWIALVNVLYLSIFCTWNYFSISLSIAFICRKLKINLV